MLALEIIALLVSIACLYFGAELLVKSSKRIATMLKLSPRFVGFVLVGYGTSTPELFTSLFANYQNHGNDAIGNVIGSNIFNVLGIIGIGSLIFALSFKRQKLFNFTNLFLILSCGILYIFTLITSKQTIGHVEGAILFVILLVFIFIQFRYEKETSFEHSLDEDKSFLSKKTGGAKLFKENILPFIVFLGSLLILIIGSNALLWGSRGIAIGYLHWDEKIVGLVLLAIATSLPELATSLYAFAKKDFNIALGNIIGSKIFNVFGIIGFTAMLKPIVITQSYTFDLSMMTLATIIMILILSFGKSFRLFGIIMLGIYTVYILISGDIIPFPRF